MLAAYMDLQAAYMSSAGDKETASLCVKGLRAETQIVAGQERDVTSEMASLHGGVVRRGAGITQVWPTQSAAVEPGKSASTREVSSDKQAALLIDTNAPTSRR